MRSKGNIVARKNESLELTPGKNSHYRLVTIPDAVYWSPANPYLYEIEVTVDIDGKTSDTWKTRFGMREFTIRDKQFVLNGRSPFI